jgi:hypothetical protein
MMRSITTCSLWFGVALFVTGCGHHEGETGGILSTNGQSSTTAELGKGSGSPSASSNTDKPNYPIRFDAASALIDVNAQQRAFAKLAIDAAKGGDDAIAKQALDRIIEVNLQQDITYKFVMILGNAGKQDQALAYAKKLIDVNRQQTALAKIANGEYDK